LAQTLHARLLIVGRHDGWFAKYAGGGTVKWAHAGAYFLKYNEGEDHANSVVHCGTGHEAPFKGHTIVDKTWIFVDNVHDFKTALTKDGTEIILHKMFAAGCGPHKHKLTKTNDLSLLHASLPPVAAQISFQFNLATLCSEQKDLICKSAGMKRKEATKEKAQDRAVQKKARRLSTQTSNA
jgi:hypothetical protein